MKYLYNAVISPIEDSPRFVACVPDLPGCVTTGDDIRDAIDMIVDAASLWLVVAEDESMTISPPTAQSDMHLEEGDIVSLIQMDTTAYRKATDNHAVRKNVSLPAWMVHMADKNGINCSQVLQEALEAKFSAL